MSKYEYLYVLQGLYSLGWEDLCAAKYNNTGRAEVHANLKDYQKNEGGSYRIVARRVPRSA